MSLTPEQQQLQEAMREVLQDVHPEFLERPGVNGMGIGFKYRGGEMTDQLAIRFYVRKKMDVDGSERLPSEIQGFTTDVIEVGDDVPLPRIPEVKDQPPGEQPEDPKGLETDNPKNKYDPLLGGISIGPSRSINGHHDAGTLGLMVVDLESGKPVMLSNYHVMCGNDGKCKKGDTICQPSRVDQTLGWCSNCAELERWFLGDYIQGSTNLGGVDGAIAKLTHRTASLNKILNVPVGSKQSVEGITAAAIGQKVYKCGRTTSLTESEIEDVDGVFTYDYGPPYNVVTLSKMVLAAKFNEGGDSGSVIVDKASDKVVALLVGSNNTYTKASPIAAVLAALNINIP